MRALLISGLLLLTASPLVADQQGGSFPADSTPRTEISRRWGRRWDFPAGMKLRAHRPRQRAVSGTVVGGYSLDSIYLRLCPDAGAGCLGEDTTKVVTLVTDSLRSLDMWTHGANAGGEIGLRLGLLAGAVAGSGEGHAGRGILVGVIGVIGGTWLGIKLGRSDLDWHPVFPCYHGCASLPTTVSP